jgi:PTS system fructose-specific IIC component
MIGSALAGGLAMASRVETQAAHGGIFVAPTSNKIGLWFLYLAIGSIVTAVIYAVIKKTPSEEDVVEEEVVDLDIDL